MTAGPSGLLLFGGARARTRHHLETTSSDRPTIGPSGSVRRTRTAGREARGRAHLRVRSEEAPDSHPLRPGAGLRARKRRGGARSDASASEHSDRGAPSGVSRGHRPALRSRPGGHRPGDGRSAPAALRCTAGASALHDRFGGTVEAVAAQPEDLRVGWQALRSRQQGPDGLRESASAATRGKS